MNYLHSEAPVKIIHRDLKSKNGRSCTCQFFLSVEQVVSLIFVPSSKQTVFQSGIKIVLASKCLIYVTGF